MLTRALSVVALAFVLLNVVLIVLVRSTGMTAAPIDVQTRGIYEQRLALLDGRHAKRGVVVGDSVIFGAHLAAEYGADWPSHALPGQIERQLASASSGPTPILNLGINGVLFRELGCVARDVLAREPDFFFLNVSPRPFAAELEAGSDTPNRSFLCSESGVGPALDRAVHSALPVLRFRDLWQFRALGTTPRAYVQSGISQLYSKESVSEQSDQTEDDEDDAFAEQLVWRFRAAARLNSIAVRHDSPTGRDLDALLDAVKSPKRTRIVVFYLHENMAALEGQIDASRFENERRRFADWIRADLAGLPRVRFIELPSPEFQGEYVDHVHLTAKGYERLAKQLVHALPPEGSPRATAH